MLESNFPCYFLSKFLSKGSYFRATEVTFFKNHLHVPHAKSYMFFLFLQFHLERLNEKKHGYYRKHFARTKYSSTVRTALFTSHQYENIQQVNIINFDVK